MSRFTKIKIKRSPKQDRYYVNVVYPEIPLSSDDVYIMSKAGDRLDLLSFEFYKDLSLWWIIMRANPDKMKRDTFMIDPGLQIRIPSNLSQILINFDKINKIR